MRLPLLGGAYSTRSIIANAQRCVNYYPEENRQDSPTPFTFYQRPGMRSIVGDPKGSGKVRGLWRSSKGKGYCVIDQNVYAITAGWELTLLGQLEVELGTQTSATDNGIDILLVDGSTKGYTIHMADNAFATVVDPTGTFFGATKVDFIDTYILWNFPGTNLFGATLSNSVSFDALFFAGKIGYPDDISTLYVNRHEVLLIGTLKSEIWYDAGNAGFPFAELPGAYIEHGAAAPYSVASNDVATFWLHQDLQGQAMVLTLRGYDVKRVSNHALEDAIAKILQSGITISDAIGYCYQQGGHSFYVLTFPQGDQTWAYDIALEAEPMYAWSQRAWTDNDPNGLLHRDRANCCAFINGVNVVGDWEDGTLKILDPNYFKDDVFGKAGPISCIRGFPHVMSTLDPSSGQVVDASDKTILHRDFMLDLECGLGPLQADGSAASVWLRWSDDRGRTWGNAILQSTGEPGKYLTAPQWRQLGFARDRVYEIGHSIAGPAALNGAWILTAMNAK